MDSNKNESSSPGRIRRARLISGIILLTFFGVQMQGFAATRYWVASSAGPWDFSPLWSATSGGPGGASIPGPGDAVFFDSGGQGNCSIPSSVFVQSITVLGSYTGVISQGANQFSANVAFFSGGSFLGSAAAINLGTLDISGGTFRSTSGLLTVGGNASFTAGVFLHNNGTTRITQSASVNITVNGNFLFNHLEFFGNYKVTTINSNLQVNGNLRLDTNSTSLALNSPAGVTVTVDGNVSTSADATQLDINTLTLLVKGNYTQSNTCACGGGTGTIQFTGNNNQIFSSVVAANRGFLPNVRIDKSGGTLSFSGLLTVVGTAWTYVAGTVLPGTSTVIFYQSNVSVRGDQSFYHVISVPSYTTVTVENNIIIDGDFTVGGATGNTLQINGSIVANGSLSFTGTDEIEIFGGALHARGNISAANTAFAGDAALNGTLIIDGSGNQFFNGSSVSSGNPMPRITIAKTGGVLTLGSNVITCYGKFTYTSGTVDATSNTSTLRVFSDAANIGILAPAASISLYNLVVETPNKTLSLEAPLDLNGSLSLLADSQLSTSASSYQLNVAGNWTASAGASFAPNTGRVFFDGTGTQVYNTNTTPATTFTFYAVTISKPSGTLSLSKPMNISNNLTLTSGTITTTATNILQMNNGASTSTGNAGSYVDGPMRYVMSFLGVRSLTFPVGRASAWRRLVLTARHNNANPANYTVELVAASAQALGYTFPATIDKVSELRYWKITRAGANNFSSTNSNVELFYENEGVVSAPSLRVAGANGTAWVDLGGTGSAAGAGSIKSTANITAFAEFSLANGTGGNNPLPVSMSYFKGSFAKEKKSAVLQWQTLTEKNNQHFVVQRMSGTGFTDVAIVPSRSIEGNSVLPLDYAYDYINPPSGNNYFRLQQVDFDGTVSNSPVINVPVVIDLRIYPNPITDRSIQVDLGKTPPGPDADYTLINTSGIVILRDALQLDTSTGHFTITIDNNVPAGFYMLTIAIGDAQYRQRVVVQ